MENLKKFLKAQEEMYNVALTEIRNGRKESHWMWYIFPQIKGLGYSEISKFYALDSLLQASDYLKHPILGKRLIQISTALLELESNNVVHIFGSPDHLKLKSSMTLFSQVPNTNTVFQEVLVKFYNGEKDTRTLMILNN